MHYFKEGVVLSLNMRFLTLDLWSLVSQFIGKKLTDCQNFANALGQNCIHDFRLHRMHRDLWNVVSAYQDHRDFTVKRLSSIWSWTPALRFQVPVIQYSQIFKQTHLREFNYHDTTTQIHSGWFLEELVRTSLQTLYKKKMLTIKKKKYHVTEDFYLMIIKSESFITPLIAFIYTCFTLCKGAAVCRGGGEGQQNFFHEAEGGVFH